MRLISPDTGTTAYAYDEAGNLASKKDANDVLTTYDYDALNRLPDRPLMKVDVSGGSIKAYFYHTDHLGTPLLMTNTAGQKVWSAVLLPFGEPYDVNEDVDGNGIPVVNNLRFPGQYYDAETGPAL